MPSKAHKKRRQQQIAKKNETRQIARQEASSLDQPTTSGLSKDESRMKLVSNQPSTSGQLSKNESRMKLVPKPPPSKIGTEISLICNHFNIILNLNEIYHYDVDITIIRPEKSKSKKESVESKKDTETITEISTTSAGFVESETELETAPKSGKAKVGKYKCLNTRINREVVDKFFLKNSNLFRNNSYVFDGVKNMYTVKSLNINKFDDTISVTDDLDRKTHFKLTIKPVEKENTNIINMEPINAFYRTQVNDIPQECSMALETILRNGPANNYFPVGRNFFPYKEKGDDILGGRILKVGFHQSMKLTQFRPVLNIDLSATTFFKPNSVMDFLSELLQMMEKEKNSKKVINLNKMPSLQNDQIIRLRQELKDTKIYATHYTIHRKFRIYDISDKSADQITFTYNEEDISITQYFYQVYGISLKFGRFPCIKINREREIFLPLEVCEIPENEHCRRKPDIIQKREIIKETAIPPNRRFENITNCVRNLIQEFSGKNEEFHIKINGKPVQLSGRILDAPHIIYQHQNKRELPFLPENGKWNLVEKRFFDGKTINKWSVLNFSNLDIKFEQFCNNFFTAGKKFGLSINNNPTYIYAKNNEKIKDYLTKVKDSDLIIVILQSKNDYRYDKIKYFAEIEIGVVTQCVVDTALLNSKEQYYANLCQKINTKLGGVNMCIDNKDLPELLNKSNPIMVIGADCNHPGKNDEVKHSVAAAVCSIDSRMFKYAATWSIQPRIENKKIELIKKFKEMVMKLLNVYKCKNLDNLPNRIIYYRDGVSEGEYEQVLDEEVKSLREACHEFRSGYQPLISCIIVNKSHHTRFVEETKQHKNIPPGTKVDESAVHFQNFDFYLCSQYGLKGTSKPAHYTVICDDGLQFYSNPDIIQKFTYFLCYLSARCTRSISIPVPVCYADLCAYRVKKYLRVIKGINSSSSDKEISRRMEEVNVIPNLKTSMYFV